jgi:hypothetical protein
MSGDEFIASEDPRAQALDRALSRALYPPALPPGFQRRLQAALARESAGAGSRAASRTHAQREQRERMAELDADYLRLRRRTLGTLIGGAFAAGAALVEDDQITRGGDRAEQFGEVFGERDRRLAGAAGERDDRRSCFADRRPVAPESERDGTGRGSARVECDRQPCAGEVVRARAGLVGD